MIIIGVLHIRLYYTTFPCRLSISITKNKRALPDAALHLSLLLELAYNVADLVLDVINGDL